MTHPDDLNTAYEIESEKNSDSPHGTPGHTGYRCGECGLDSLDPHPIYSHDQLIDTLQNRLLDWNEECDYLTRGHMNDCPPLQPLRECEQGHWPMPAKPERLVERMHRD